MAGRLPPKAKLISIVEVSAITDLSESTIRRRIKDNESDFPRPLEIGRRRPFALTEISRYVERRKKARGNSARAV